jgi:hypothetical protein
VEKAKCLTNREVQMKQLMRSSAIGAALALVALALVPAAAANKPIREVIPAPDDRVIDDQCTFPVLGHIEGSEINTTFTDRAGNRVKQFGHFPGNTLTLTNLDTGKSITRGTTGSFQLRAERDGSATGMVTDHGVWLGHPVTGDPGLWYQTGRVSATLDANGNTSSSKATGTLIDLCLELAS